ncbi:DNA/RNA nuclease SfsA [uncultured Megasphaera sp.]|uniref:DNA/RNA nuclease SfsA n=1 Tax=uncultured Megasphaera sp. TaxID=165188 RepID=UPI0025971384|nr:DNA/RNA nuclease SfsA [uncultured Megasphaera sp.]
MEWNTSLLKKGTFIRRMNRFVCEVEIDGISTICHLPNPGRMWELLFSQVSVYVRQCMNATRKTPYDLVGVEREGIPVLLDTQYTNDVAAYFIQHKQIPEWRSWKLIRREVTVGHSRFDLLLGRGDERFYVEVKSCTLFSKNGAMFPDAVTERGKKHLLALAAMHDKGIRTGLLFLVHWDRAKWFLPDYHTDPEFATVFSKVEHKLDWQAVSVQWDESFQMPRPRERLLYPSAILQQENKDAGAYMLVLEVEQERDIEVGKKGIVHVCPGYYVYVGSAKKNLAARIARHKRNLKRLHWHIDYLRQVATVRAVIPIRTSADVEHILASQVARICDWRIRGFGCTDCACTTHLFAFKENPIHLQTFMKIVEEVRMNRLDACILANLR